MREEKTEMPYALRLQSPETDVMMHITIGERAMSAIERQTSKLEDENKKLREVLASIISPASCMLRGDEGSSIELSLAVNKAMKLIRQHHPGVVND